MPLGAFAVGYYNFAYTPPTGTPGAGVAQDPGLVEGVRRFRRRKKGIQIKADLYGDSVIDGIYRGEEIFFQMTFKEWKAALLNVLHPYSTAGWGDLGLIGRLDSDLAGDCTLTVLPGTPAATHGPSTIRARKLIIADENDLDFVLGNDQRDVPVLFRALPYEDGNVIRHFELT